MKTVKKLRTLQERLGRGGTYYLHTYIVEDDLGNKEDIDSIAEFDEGDRVETWFDDQYNKTKMRLYRPKRSKE